jgi:phage terminase small subunit
MGKTIAPEMTCPEHLSPRSQELYRQLVPARAKSVERIALVVAGLEALDRAEEARQAVAVEGMISKTETTGALHVHPLVKVERESRQQFMRCWEILNLQWNARVDGGVEEL